MDAAATYQGSARSARKKAFALAVGGEVAVAGKVVEPLPVAEKLLSERRNFPNDDSIRLRIQWPRIPRKQQRKIRKMSREDKLIRTI